MEHPNMSPVALIYSEEYERRSCLSPKYQNRFSIIMDLIRAYELHNKVSIIPPLNDDELSITDLNVFHSSDYLEFLSKLSISEENGGSCGTDSEEDLLEMYGLAYDCPPFSGVLSYSLASVQGSLAAAKALMTRQYKIVINWAGGWHHAKRSEASGFCYLNDCVLACLALLPNSFLNCDGGFSRILYIDLDLHHGDGVEEAFAYRGHRHHRRPNVFTVSLHCDTQHGFFPAGRGCMWDSSLNPPTAAPLTYLNLPLGEGCSDATYFRVFHSIIPLIKNVFDPLAVVVQCGADGLARDPHKAFNLSVEGSLLPCLQTILSWDLPTILLGGGGYCWSDTARFWTQVTAAAVELHNNAADTSCVMPEIPESSEYFALYGPDFDLKTDVGLRPEFRSAPDVDKTIDCAKKHIETLQMLWTDNVI